MEGAIETLTRGNVAEVKIVLASRVAAVAVYQVTLMAVRYVLFWATWASIARTLQAVAEELARSVSEDPERHSVERMLGFARWALRPLTR